MPKSRSKTNPKPARAKGRPPASAAARARAGEAGDQAVRKRVVEMLRGGHAHTTFRRAVRDFPPELRGRKPAGAAHTPWQVLEHLRICQWDILEFSRDPRHVSPEYPAGYWPEKSAPAHGGEWESSVKTFEADLETMVRLVANRRRNLHARVGHPEAEAHHTLLREALVLADHNAYHLGELVLLRRLLGAWPAEG